MPMFLLSLATLVAIVALLVTFGRTIVAVVRVVNQAAPGDFEGDVPPEPVRQRLRRHKVLGVMLSVAALIGVMMLGDDGISGEPGDGTPWQTRLALLLFFTLAVGAVEQLRRWAVTLHRHRADRRA